MDQRDLELLEMYLDGELPQEQARALEERLAVETQLERQLERLEMQRVYRRRYFASLEPAESDLAGVVARITRPATRAARDERSWLVHRLASYAAAAAACVAVGLMVGRFVDWSGNVARQGESADVAVMPAGYDVAIMDETGTVLGVHQFSTLEQAREFSEDLKRWHERQEQLRRGQVTVRSAKF